MVFVDNLAYLLFILGAVSILTLYTTVSVFLAYRKNKNLDVYRALGAGVIPLGAIGVYLFIMAAYGQMTWPLIGAYNMVFFDSLLSLSLILIGFALCVKYRQKMQYVGLFGLLSGIWVIYYAYAGYMQGLTQSPPVFAGMFIAYGLAGVLSYPMALMFDREPGKRSDHPGFWKVVVVLFWLALIASAVLALLTGVLAIPAHFANPP